MIVPPRVSNFRSARSVFGGFFGAQISHPSGIQVYTCNPNDLYFHWKRPCFGGLKPQNRGQTGSRYLYIPGTQMGPLVLIGVQALVLGRSEDLSRIGWSWRHGYRCKKKLREIYVIQRVPTLSISSTYKYFGRYIPCILTHSMANL